MEGEGEGYAGSGDGGGAGASVGLEDVAVEDDGALAEGFHVDEQYIGYRLRCRQCGGLVDIQRPPTAPQVTGTQADQSALQAVLARRPDANDDISLLAAIDRTVTPAGSRLLAQRLAAPLTAPDAIARRHNAVAHFVADAAARGEVRERLNAAPDLARALARLVVGRGGPRDLAAIRDGLIAGDERVERRPLAVAVS